MSSVNPDRFPPLRYRQIHLDFHTSEYIPEVGRDFDAEDFVRTLREANVDSVTLFARCHHGWCYYPSEVGPAHPNLVRPDLLGEMVEACRAADIETPIYVTAQWDEHLARERPEWRVMSASNGSHDIDPRDDSAMRQLSATWHTLCLGHGEYRRHLIDMGLELIERYDPPGLFFDIVSSHQCVCPSCLDRLHEHGLDPRRESDRVTNDLAVNESFRQELSAALWARAPSLRLFYNCGHIERRGRERFRTYSHLELESLPTGGWGYDHFPSGARYAATLGMDFLGQTGKFHTSWGEFGGFKQADALLYECAQMIALGAKCLIGDQLHPSGAINADTYRFVAPAYAHVRALEPFLRNARQTSEVAILAAECFSSKAVTRLNPSDGDDGAARMLLELHVPFDVIDPGMDFTAYRLLILPDEVPVDAFLGQAIASFVAGGGKVLFSGRSGRDPESGALALEAGVRVGDAPHDTEPSYLRVLEPMFGKGTPVSPIVMYGRAERASPDGAQVLAECLPAYFDRDYRRFCSHQHTPDDPDAAPLGAAITLSDAFGYVAYPIFGMYRRSGQPIYRHLVAGLLGALLPDPMLGTSLPSGARASLCWQEEKHRFVLHLLYGAPQIRGRASPSPQVEGVVEMIEDIPTLADVRASVRVSSAPIRVVDAASGEAIEHHHANGRVEIRLPRLHVHVAIAIEMPPGTPSPDTPGTTRTGS